MKRIVFVLLFFSDNDIQAQSCKSNKLDKRVAYALERVLKDLPGHVNTSVETIRDIRIETPAFPVEDVVTIRITNDSIPLHVLNPLKSKDLPIVIYYHPGGFVTPLLPFMKYECWRIARTLNAVLFAVDYRVAPEYKFPAAVNDAYGTFKWVLANGAHYGGDTRRMIVFGLSAGGNLAAVVCQKAKREGIADRIRLQVLNCPSLDNPLNGSRYPSYDRYGEGYFLTKAFCHFYINVYAPGVDIDDTEIAPVREKELSGLPPALIISAEFDPLRDEATLYVDRLREAGVPVLHKCFAGQIHCLLGLPPDAREVKEADSLVLEAMSKYLAN